MRRLTILSFLTFLVFMSSLTAYADIYYIAPSGSDAKNGLSEDAAWRTFAHATNILQPGDTLILLDGKYDEELKPIITGTETAPITFKAKNIGAAIIERTTDGRGIYVYSSPTNILSYLIFDGLTVRSKGEYDAIYLDSQDNSLEHEMTHHITMKNCSTFGSANYTNTMSFKISRVRDSLVEDCWAYGFGRKSVQLYGCIRMTVRRMVARYDYWDGGAYKPNDPRIGFAVYNSKNGIYENIIVLDCAPDPPGREAASKAGFAIEGNVTSTSSFLGSTDNKFLGIISLDNDYNGFYTSGVSSGQNNNNIIQDFAILGATNNGIVLHAESSNNIFSHGTTGRNKALGLRINNTSVDNNTLDRLVAINNIGYGFYLDAGGTNNILQNTSAVNNSNADIEPEVAPVFTYLVKPTMDINYERGATIVNRYVDGTLTEQKLWPWPNEDLIKNQMCNQTDLISVHRIAANGAGWEPAWCASGKSLTQYIWEYLGNPIPTDIYKPTPTITSIQIQ